MSANHPELPDGSVAATPGRHNGGPAARDQAAEQAAQVAGTAAGQGRQVAGTAADEARQVAGAAQGEAGRVASEASAQVRGLVSEATAQVEDHSRTQLGRLAETLRSCGEDFERMASQGEGPATGLAREAADRARGFAAHLEGREPRDLVEDVRGFARRRPGVFLVGSLVAGVVAGRLTRGAKAARGRNESGRDESGRDESGRAGSGRAGSGRDASGRSGARSGSGASAGTSRRDPQSYVSDARHPSSWTADVTSPGDPQSYVSGTAPSSGPISDPSTHEGRGTASGDPLAGVGTPESEPVYPGGTEEGRR